MKRKLGLGLDFGNSNTTLAVYDGASTTFINLDGGSAVMPSALYMRREGLPLSGRTAVSAYLDDNRGRVITPERVNVGTIHVTMGEGDNEVYSSSDRSFHAVLHAAVDTDQPGRLFTGLKGFLGNEGEQIFSVFGKRFRLEALITVLFNQIRKAAEDTGTDISSGLVIGRPVIYSGNSENPNGTAMERMTTICGNSGIEFGGFLSEPEAAALSYIHKNGTEKLSPGRAENILVFDYGGGTLDFCILNRCGTEFRVLAVDGIPRAGDYIDRMILSEVVFPELGKGLMLRNRFESEAYPFPFDSFEPHLLNWQSSYCLNERQFRNWIDMGMRSSTVTGGQLERLEKVITGNLAYHLKAAAEKAKIELSTAETSFIDCPEAGILIPLTRSRLLSILDPVLTEIETRLQVLTGKTVPGGVAGIDRVVCSGGSARLASVRSLLEGLFPGKVEEWDPFRSIAAGLAVRSYYG